MSRSNSSLSSIPYSIWEMKAQTNSRTAFYASSMSPFSAFSPFAGPYGITLPPWYFMMAFRIANNAGSPSDLIMISPPEPPACPQDFNVVLISSTNQSIDPASPRPLMRTALAWHILTLIFRPLSPIVGF